jgi:hypothetical protein
MMVRFVSMLALFIGTLVLSGHASPVDAAPSCDSEAVEDGSLIYTQVFDAKPIKKKPPHVKALLPKRTMGAKLYVKPQKGVTREYLHHAALCHAASDRPPAFRGDPLRVDGDVRAIRVYPAGPSLVVSILADDPATGREIWERARALTVDVDADLTKAKKPKKRDL